MTTTGTASKTESVRIPKIPALYANAREAFVLDTDGSVERLSHAAARKLSANGGVLVCHAPYTAKRLELDSLPLFDVLELFAFVHPATFCVPTPVGICRALGMQVPKQAEDYPYALMECAGALLSDLRKDTWRGRADPLKIAGVMGQNGRGWAWTPYIFAAHGQAYDAKEPVMSRADLNIWKNLPEWAEEAPPPPASHHPVTGEEARERLTFALGHRSEKRGEQMDYANAMTAMFIPPAANQYGEVNPHGVLAEAGTGVGKTLGYLSPASVWAEKNKGSVWVSTYTKNLQRQIHQELGRIYPDPEVRESRVAVRKGRENYLCLLNLEESAAGAALAKNPREAIASGIMARWAAATKDGDLTGSDFPGWLTGLLGPQNSTGLSDRRGECIYSACEHYHRCFIERSVRKARHASVVVANHALVMIQTADSNPESDLPRHYIFDEGHHLFDAADSAYGGHLTALETYEIRRWLRGNEGGRKSRARGLKRRAEDLVAGDPVLEATLQDILDAAKSLTTDGWTVRLKDAAPAGAAEEFLHAVYRQVHARADGRDGPYSLETDTRPVADDVVPAAKKLKTALGDIQAPMAALTNALRKRLHEQADILDPDTRRRIDAVVSSLDLKAMTISGWIAMLETLEQASTPEQFIDWMEIERIEGRAVDVGLYRHWVDPMVPFAKSISLHAHGMAVTSATLRDGTEDEEENWRVARDVSGLSHLTPLIHQAKFDSPFDYAERTKVFIIKDVRKDDLAQVSTAYRTLFEASNGGGLGLFTAIQRLRAVHGNIAAKLEERGLHLYAQHIDAMDNGTLVDIFRDDVNACLLGTDAVRDGVDVPGDSLRLIVFDRVPWPRPTILHRARREAFGGRRYDERIARLKLKQAFGRLIRRADDKGVFVMMDSMLPSRLHGAFPPGVEIQKVGLSEAAAQIRDFLKIQ
ncbi:MAG: ATP-dependent DNA helicase [Micavibrio aeruginosavorus]|uniref:ATP-dependent DNA helicase n=1 Tax=Micavibrio aeruginosavorus TaxID=349221 RepID=A0A2W5C315_9BACT|nr:MAG: ATP-dependent DNA helicase [Micavibrio aeruginosavorus]